MTACAQYYESMGLDKYRELVWEDFLSRMKEPAGGGVGPEGAVATGITGSGKRRSCRFLCKCVQINKTVLIKNYFLNIPA